MRVPLTRTQGRVGVREFRALCEERCVGEKPGKILSDGPEIGGVEGWLARMGSWCVWLHSSGEQIIVVGVLLLCYKSNITF